LTPCDKKIGAGVTFPSGTAASNRRCELDGGQRYITSSQQDMDEAFACIAQVGTGGAGAQARRWPPRSSRRSTTPDDEYACNGGFLRTTRSWSSPSSRTPTTQDSLGTVDEWIAALRTAKNGDDDAFMVLVLTTDVDLGYMQLCLPNEYNPNPNRLRTLADDVEHGFVGSICMPEGYGDWFKERVTYLVDLCDDFVPPGLKRPLRVMNPDHCKRLRVGRAVAAPPAEAPRVTGDGARTVLAHDARLVRDSRAEGICDGEDLRVGGPLDRTPALTILPSRSQAIPLIWVDARGSSARCSVAVPSPASQKIIGCGFASGASRGSTRRLRIRLRRQRPNAPRRGRTTHRPGEVHGVPTTPPSGWMRGL
jgi:hypothetical protein